MERLTNERRLKENQEVRLFSEKWQKLYRRLQAYEDTGFEPEEIRPHIEEAAKFGVDDGMETAWKMAWKIYGMTDDEFREFYGAGQRHKIFSEDPSLVQEKLAEFLRKAAPPDPDVERDKRFYNDGVKDAMYVVKKFLLAPSMGGYPINTIFQIFGVSSISVIFDKYTYNEIISKFHEYEAAKQKTDDEIHVGDVCVFIDAIKVISNSPFVVTRTYRGKDDCGRTIDVIDGLREDGSVLRNCELSIIKKVGYAPNFTTDFTKVTEWRR